MSDPKLKEAMAEIKAILKKHDIGGQISLVSPNNCEFMYALEPSWNLIRMEALGNGSSAIRFLSKSKMEDFLSIEQQHKITEQSVWLLLAIKDLASQAFKQMEAIEKHLREKFEVNHGSLSGFEPHQEH